MSNFCWLCERNIEWEEAELIKRCPHCGVDNDRTPYEENNGGDMGKLAELAKQRSPFIRIAIGESSEPMVYKSWKEISSQFGESFRYIFEVETPNGLVTKSFDCPQQKFAEAMDGIAYGTKVIISRIQKVDAQGNDVEKKSLYEVKLVE